MVVVAFSETGFEKDDLKQVEQLDLQQMLPICSGKVQALQNVSQIPFNDM